MTNSSIDGRLLTTCLKVASGRAWWNSRSVWCAVLVVTNTLLADSGGVSSIAGADIMRSGVSWEGISLGTSHAELWVGTVLALPELAAWLGGITVLWAWAESLLLAVVLDQEEGQRNGEEEENTREHEISFVFKIVAANNSQQQCCLAAGRKQLTLQ